MRPYHASLLLVLGCAGAALGGTRAEGQLPCDQLLGTDVTQDEAYGTALALASGRALVGARDHDHVPGASGAVYVFEPQAGAWVETAELLPSGTPPDFGYSLALAYDRAAIATQQPTVHVFEHDGAAWSEVAVLASPSPFPNSDFGQSLNLDGDRLVAGDTSYGPDPVLGTLGCVFVLDRAVDGTWKETATLQGVPSGFQALGWKVAVEGADVLASAHSGPGTQFTGVVHAFEQQPDGAFGAPQVLQAADAALFDDFGFDLDLDGGRVLIGAPEKHGAVLGAGAAYVFEKVGGVWVETAKLLAPNQVGGGRFGTSVALEGDVAVIGEFQYFAAQPYGSAHVWRRLADGSWVHVDQLAFTGPAQPGWEVALSQGVALVSSLDPGTPAVPAPVDVFAVLLATEEVRLGSPPNPAALLGGQTSGPVVGANWDPLVDHQAFVPGAVADVLGVTAAPLNLPLPPFGTLLCDVLSAPPFVYTAAPGSAFQVPIPSSCALVGIGLCAQAFATDGVTGQLTNALDVGLGTL